MLKNDLYFALTYSKGLVSGGADDIRRAIDNAGDVRKLHKIEGGLPVSVSAWDFLHPAAAENQRHVDSIAAEMEVYHNGDAYRCPMCGEIVSVDYDDHGDKFKCPGCGEILDFDDLEQLGLWDYLEDALDIEYIVQSDRKTIRGVRVMVACGGPNIYIDTMTGCVELYWWGDRASGYFSRDVRDALDEWAQELFDLG